MVLAQISLTAGILHFPCFLKPGKKGLSPLSFIRTIREGRRVDPLMTMVWECGLEETYYSPRTRWSQWGRSSCPLPPKEVVWCFQKGGCCADELNSVKKSSEQANFRNLTFMLWVLGKLSGREAGHDVFQMYLSSGGREAPSWPCSQNVIFFSYSETRNTRTASSTGNHREGPVYFQNGIEMVQVGAGKGAPSLL